MGAGGNSAALISRLRALEHHPHLLLRTVNNVIELRK